MAGRFFVVRGSVTSGPFSSRQLKEMAAAGGIQPTDGVQQEGKGKIHLARTVVGLFPAGDQAQLGSTTVPSAITSPTPATAPTGLGSLPLRRSAATPELTPVLLAAAPPVMRGTTTAIDGGGHEWVAAHVAGNALRRQASDLLGTGSPSAPNVPDVPAVDPSLPSDFPEPGEYNLAPVDWSPPQPPSALPLVPPESLVPPELPVAEAAASLGSDGAAADAGGGGWFESWFGGGEVDATGADGSWFGDEEAVAGADLADAADLGAAADLADAADLGDAADMGLDALGDIDFSCFF